MTCHELSDKINLTKNSNKREYLMSIPFQYPLGEHESVIITLLYNMKIHKPYIKDKNCLV